MSEQPFGAHSSTNETLHRRMQSSQHPAMQAGLPGGRRPLPGSSRCANHATSSCCCTSKVTTLQTRGTAALDSTCQIRFRELRSTRRPAALYSLTMLYCAMPDAKCVRMQLPLNCDIRSAVLRRPPSTVDAAGKQAGLAACNRATVYFTHYCYSLACTSRSCIARRRLTRRFRVGALSML